MLQDVVEREKPPHYNSQAGFPPIPDILDPQCPVDGLAQYPARPGPPGKHKVFVLDRRPREDATMQTHERDPLRFPARPAERFQCFLPATQVLDHGSPVTIRPVALQVADNDSHVCSPYCTSNGWIFSRSPLASGDHLRPVDRRRSSPIKLLERSLTADASRGCREPHEMPDTRVRPSNQQVTHRPRDASPLECSGASCHGLLREVSTLARKDPPAVCRRWFILWCRQPPKSSAARYASPVWDACRRTRLTRSPSPMMPPRTIYK